MKATKKLVPMRETRSRVIPISSARTLHSIPPLEQEVRRQPISLARALGEHKVVSIAPARRRKAA